MSERSSVSRRAWRGALIALVAIALGTTTAAGASETGPAGRAGAQQEGPATATFQPITPGTERSAPAEAAPGDVAALAASNLSYNTVDPCRIFDTRQTGTGTIGAGRPYNGFDLGLRGVCGIPADGSAKAIMVNVIAVNTRGTG